MTGVQTCALPILQALVGAEPLIRRARPTLAISVYHRPGDPWNLMQFVHDIDSSYRFLLRTEGEDGMDLICFAIPGKASV